jgi:hypothetical protein
MYYKYSLFLPFFSTLMIVLNVYNGDVTGMPSSLEYMLWYIPSLLIGLKTVKLYMLHVPILGLALNIFWHYESPWNSNKLIRHRTEYYDTQCLLCSMLYHHIYELYRYPNRIITPNNSDQS